jgi:hypothetical protein
VDGDIRLRSDNERLRSDNERLRSENERLRSENERLIEELEDSSDKFKEELSKVKADNLRLVKERRELSVRIAELERQVSDLDREAVVSQNTIQGLQSELKRAEKKVLSPPPATRVEEVEIEIPESPQPPRPQASSSGVNLPHVPIEIIDKLVDGWQTHLYSDDPSQSSFEVKQGSKSLQMTIAGVIQKDAKNAKYRFEIKYNKRFEIGSQLVDEFEKDIKGQSSNRKAYEKWYELKKMKESWTKQ